MTDNQKSIGEKMNEFDFSIIRTLRMKWGLTAEELAVRAKVTRATVAKIESGSGNPTIETLAALSRVFQIPVSELIRTAESSLCEKGLSEPYDSQGIHGTRIGFPNFELFRLKAGAGIDQESEPSVHDNTAEICVVLSGRIRLSVRGETLELGPNGSLRFKALHSHRIEVLEDAEFLLIHHNLP
jgi:XRE family transcriptional regulator, regulator of sulfur utilization